MRIVMVGAGYVGLVSGACLADFGHEVVCVEVDESKVESLRQGHVPIYEPGLSELAVANQAAGRLSFTTSLKEAGRGAQAIFIAVGTPSLAEVGSADMHFVHDAARAIGQIIEDFTVVVVKSTVPIGAGDEVERIIAKHAPAGSFAVVSNPEFLREGAAIEDFKRPDRVVIGVEGDRAREVMGEIYRPIERNGGRIVYTSRRSSEMIKYAANVFLAMKVTFINEIADLCERLGADVQDVSHGIGLDDRIGRKFLNPGPGFGGSCFPKDTLALTKLAAEAKAPIRLVETLVDVNDKRKTAMAAKVVAACGGSVAGKRIAVLGLTYKPRTDDMRDAPSSSSCLSCRRRARVLSPTIQRVFEPRNHCYPASSSQTTPMRASRARTRLSSSPSGTSSALSTLPASRPACPRRSSSTCATSIRSNQ